MDLPDEDRIVGVAKLAETEEEDEMAEPSSDSEESLPPSPTDEPVS